MMSCACLRFCTSAARSPCSTVEFCHPPACCVGPLSASLDAYLATEIAVQWSPLQVAGGIELHGEVQLEAFGIGITAGALLEATAPNPFWVYGSLQLELDPPWPLPNVGGTVILEWGPNGPAPPAARRRSCPASGWRRIRPRATRRATPF